MYLSHDVRRRDPFHQAHKTAALVGPLSGFVFLCGAVTFRRRNLSARDDLYPAIGVSAE